VERFIGKVHVAVAGNADLGRIEHQILDLEIPLDGLEVRHHAAYRDLLVAAQQHHDRIGDVEVGQPEQQLTDGAAVHDQRRF